MEETLETLAQEELRLGNLLREIRHKQKILHTAEFVEKNGGIDIGDKIEWMEGSLKYTGIVSKFDFSGVKPIYYFAKRFNKSGILGSREQRIWSYNMASVILIEKAQ